jgi:hypothetical protein
VLKQRLFSREDLEQQIKRKKLTFDKGSTPSVVDNFVKPEMSTKSKAQSCLVAGGIVYVE